MSAFRISSAASEFDSETAIPMLTLMLSSWPATRIGSRRVASNPLGDLHRGLGRVDLFEQDRELVAAEPGDRVAGPKVGVETARDGDQELIPDGVGEASR